MVRRLPTLVLYLGCLLLLSACVTIAPETASAPTVVDPSSAETRGILRLSHPVLNGENESLDPASPTEFGFATVFLFDRLVRLGEDGTPSPGLAVSWTANEDNSEWTFTLRQGVTFHNDQPFTSADVAYTFEHILDPEVQSRSARTFGLINSVETPDEATAVFRLNQSHADFPLMLTSRYSAIIPAGSSDTIGDTGIGTGPFKLESLNPEGTTIMSANDAYWDGKPGLAGVELIGMTDAESRVLAAQSGQLDLLYGLPAVSAELFVENSNFTVLDFPGGAWTGLVMRTDMPPFDDVRVRKAMRLAVDRQEMMSLLLDGQGIVACDTPVTQADAYRWEGECPQDIEQAKSLLADAGYPTGIDVTLYASSAFPQMIPMAEVYQQQATMAGINVTLEIIPPDSYWTDVWMVEPFYADAFAGRPADEILNLVWRSGAPMNVSFYQNPDFDQLLTEARKTSDFQARREVYQEAQRLLFEDGGILIPFHATQFHVLNAGISGVQARDFQYIDWHLVSKSE